MTFPSTGRSDETVSYRTCQAGAFWAFKSHLTTHPNDAAIISLPTGAGKTALMMLAAFEVSADRVLIIPPNKVIRNQIADRFRTLEGLAAAGALQNDLASIVSGSGPTVTEITSQQTDEETWRSHEDADVVVALPNSTSPEFDDDIVLPPAEMFDLLCIDEAHHSAAKSWRQVIRSISDTPRLSLTATPFRTDRLDLPGRLIYHYPIDKAVRDDIYAEVRFKTVESQYFDNIQIANTPQFDEMQISKTVSLPNAAAGTLPLVAKASVMLREYQRSNSEASALIRTDTISKANTLSLVYSEWFGLDVVPFHSQSDLDPGDLRTELAEESIDGAVIVNQVAEGLDIPELQLLVFHALPQSFPYFVQFVGRLARRSVDTDPPTVFAAEERIADANIKSPARRLYQENQAWEEVIPKLVNTYVNTQAEVTDFSIADEHLSINETKLTPDATVDIYRTDTVTLDLTDGPRADTTFDKLQLGISDGEQFVGFLTMSRTSPSWARRTELELPRCDLHLYYTPEEAPYLFEYSSNRQHGKSLRRAIVTPPENLSEISESTLTAVMRGLPGLEYITTGLRKTTDPSGPSPELKTFHGTKVERTVRPSDGRQYTRGHVYGTYEQDSIDEESSTQQRGISSKNARVWENDNLSPAEFQEWCNELSRRLQDSTTEPLQNLEFLDNTEPVDAFDSRPFTITLPPEIVNFQSQVKSSDNDNFQKTRIDIQLDDDLDDDSYPEQYDVQTLDVEFSFESIGESVTATYDVEGDMWTGDITDWEFRLIDRDTSQTDLEGTVFLSEYSPRFHLPNGDMIEGGIKYSPTRDLSQFDPQQCITPDSLNWEDYTDGNREEILGQEEPPSDSDLLEQTPPDTRPFDWENIDSESVHQIIVSHRLSVISDRKHILFYDQMSGEAADVIEFIPEKKDIRLYHCKADATEGVSIGRVEEAQQQLIRSLRWTFNDSLCTHIWRREGNSELRYGTADDEETIQHFITGREYFQGVKEDFQPQLWDFTICIVNPGLTLEFDFPSDTNKEQNAGILLNLCEERCTDNDVKFEVYSSDCPRN